MSTANVFVKVGTTLARVKPENVESVRLQMERASKVPTPKQARARALMGGVTRKYPRFKEGATAEQYAVDYYALNAEQFKGHTVDRIRRDAATEMVKGFFQPLSTVSMFTPSGEVLEETI